MYGPWKIDPSDKKKSAMKMICLGEEQKVINWCGVVLYYQSDAENLNNVPSHIVCASFGIPVWFLVWFF